MIKKKPKIYIGIDPAFRKKGFAMAIIDTTDNTVNFKTFKNGFLDFMGWMISDKPSTEEAVFCIENSNLQSVTFDMRGNKNVVARKSRNVGKNQAASQYTVWACQANGYKVIDLSPKDKGGKWTEDGFKWVVKSKKLILSKAKPNQDERDALKLAIIALNKWQLAK